MTAKQAAEIIELLKDISEWNQVIWWTLVSSYVYYIAKNWGK